MNELSTKKLAAWRVWGTSVQGTQHQRRKIPNQDAIEWVAAADEGAPIVMAISDGHGSAGSFRSDRGAQLAVSVACQTFSEFVSNATGLAQEEAAAELQKTCFPALLRRWRTSVKDDFEANPMTEDDVRLLNGKAAEQGGELDDEALYLAYGATLLVVCLCDDYVIYFQLGDGDIVVVDEFEEVGSPLPEDAALIANETHSLCSRDALQQVRFKVVPLARQCPLMILMCTDGYSNAFESRQAFLQAGTDYLKLHRTEGLDSLKELIPAFLHDASSTATGDDVTLGLIKRVERFDIDTLWDELKGLRQLHVDAKATWAAKQDDLLVRLTRMSRATWLLAAIQLLLLIAFGMYVFLSQ